MGGFGWLAAGLLSGGTARKAANPPTVSPPVEGVFAVDPNLTTETNHGPLMVDGVRLRLLPRTKRGAPCSPNARKCWLVIFTMRWTPISLQTGIGLGTSASS